MYNILRIDADPTAWELSEAVEQVPTSSAPVVLPVSHPLLGHLVLSPRSMGSAVFLEFPDVHGTRPNGLLAPGSVLYVPSPTGVDVHAMPPNFYLLADAVDLAALEADIIASMTSGTVLTVNVAGGVVMINGAALPFAVVCPRRLAARPATS